MASPYVHYTKLTKMIVKKEMEEAARANGTAAPKMIEVLKEVKRRWEALSDEERKAYEDERKAYSSEARHSLLSNLEQRDVPQTLRKQFEDIIPKKPPTAVQLFAKEHPPTSSKSGRSAELRVEEAWAATSSAERERFETEAARLQAEYQKRYKEWQTTPEYAQICKAEEVESRKREQARSAEMALAAKRPRVEKEKTPVRFTYGEEEIASTPAITVVSKGAKKKSAASAASSATAPAAANEVPPEILQEAEDMKMKAAFLNLSQRPEILNSQCSHREILAALKRCGGLVNPAKRALLADVEAEATKAENAAVAASKLASMPEGLLSAAGTQ